MNGLFKFLFFLTSYLVAITGLAQNNAGRYRFEHITVDDGLAHSDATGAVQDQAGFIWIATFNGINRYDGYELKKYTLPFNSRNGLSGNRIRALYIDPKNHIWVGTENAGLCLFDADQDRFISVSQRVHPSVSQTLVRQFQEVEISAITAEHSGRIWVGTYASGLFVLTLNPSHQIIQIEPIPLFVHREITYSISALVSDRDGTMWIGTYNHGLWSINLNKTGVPNPRAQPAPLNVSTVRALFLDHRGDLWIGTELQIFWVNQAQRQARRSFSEYPLPQSGFKPECIYVDSFGHLWVGTSFGLLMWEPRSMAKSYSSIPVLTDQYATFLPDDNDPSTINSGIVHKIFEDRNQLLWVSTATGGLNKVNLRDKPFRTLHRRGDQQPTLANNSIYAIQQDKAHNWLWIGTRNGFSRYDLTTKKYRNYTNKSLPGDAPGIEVSAFCQASDGALWVSTRYNGLLMLKGDKLRVLNRLPDGASLKASRLESILEDRYGTIWVASFELGLLRFNHHGQLVQRFHNGNSRLPTNRFTFLLYDNEKDLLWASTQNAGVVKLQLTATSLQVLNQFSYRADDSTSLSDNYAWPLLKDHQNRLWIGTIGGGLNLLTTTANGQDVIRRFNQQVPISDVENLLEDETGQLWVAGTGLLRFNPVTGQSQSYGVADGLPSNSFKVGASWQATDGTLYFGGIKGITYFQPRLIQPNPYAPVVQLTGLRIFNKSVDIGKPVNGQVILTRAINQTKAITLQASDTDFALDFVGFNYANPHKHTYAYRLKGYTDGWVIPPPGQRSVSFANLPAGDYTFEVKASNGEGKWSAQPATLRITILPPWYRTWLAYGVYMLLLAGALLAFRRITLAQQKMKNALALEKFKTEKEKEITDLKLRFFTNISHELRTPLTLILGPMEELALAKGSYHEFRGKVSLMHQQTRKLMDLVNQLMEFRKVESGHVDLRVSEGDMVRFLTELFMIFRFKADELQIDFALKAPTVPVPLYFDRNKMEILLTNLLANALKYTPRGGKIRLLVSVVGSPNEPAQFDTGKLLDNYLQIIVRDWGIGMKAAEVEKIFDAYYQASHTETMHILGTGIGLSLVKQYVEAHAGEVSVQSEPGVGTAFTLRFPFGRLHLSPASIMAAPLAIERLPTTESSTTSDPASRLSGSSVARILVVEDNEDLQRYLQQLLEPAFTVFTACDGVEGWGKALDLLPDLVVSDVMMSRSDGLTLCRTIKQHPKTAHIPVILLTARVAAVHELEGLEMGADEYMVKPFSPKILYAKIAAILQGRQQLQAYYQRQILLEPTNVAIPDAERQLLEKAMRIVEANLDKPDFNVPWLVREMGMSQSTFYRQIKAITGQSVVEFIGDVRMKRAAQLLITGGLRVSEVAMLVGMEDLNHFRKSFISVYNLSPSDYAKQHQEPTKAD